MKRRVIIGQKKQSSGVNPAALLSDSDDVSMPLLLATLEEKEQIIEQKTTVIGEQKKRIALLEEYLRLEGYFRLFFDNSPAHLKPTKNINNGRQCALCHGEEKSGLIRRNLFSNLLIVKSTLSRLIGLA